MSQLSHQYPDNPERWNPFAGAPKARHAAELFREMDARRFAGVATFCGTQEAFEHFPAVDLWNLTAPLGGHPVNSTVTRETLIELLKQ